ncbi:MAG: AAA family ATPase [Nitrospirae bacterium]|nr:AAA family ATPase [Nitrospirota bacterium]
MYESFYGLRTKPFALLPDHDFLYPGSTHRAAYSLLEYGLINEAPFMVITGDPGMGKTSLLQKLVAEHGAKHSIGLVTNARYDVEHLLPWILLSLGLSKHKLDPVEAYHVFSEFLTQESKQHRRVILIIDEAQSLGSDLLEELRLLSNLNDGKTLKLQIILSGQPDLHTLLRRIDMTQLAQRIVVDYHLEPLSEEETRLCIRHRIQVAGGHLSLFTDKACALVHRLTRGNPRLINQVCDVALTYGFAEQARVITSKLVAQAAFDRSKGGILPLAAVEDLSMLANAPEDTTEIDTAPPQPGSPQPRQASLSQDFIDSQSIGTPEPFYEKGVAMRREGRFREAINMLEMAEMLEQSGKAPSMGLKAQAQIGLCHRSTGDYQSAIQAFRSALKDTSATPQEMMDVQYFLARTLESAGEKTEAAPIYRRIAQTNPGYKDVAQRAKDLASKQKHLSHSNGNGHGKRGDGSNRSWLSNAIARLISARD